MGYQLPHHDVEYYESDGNSGVTTTYPLVVDHDDIVPRIFDHPRQELSTPSAIPE